MSAPKPQKPPSKQKVQTAEEIMDMMRDPRHNPEKAVAMIKALHVSSGRPVTHDHDKFVREGFVQRFDPNEVVMERNGKIGYRKAGSKTGPLRRLSASELKLLAAEKNFLSQIAKMTSLDNCMTHFVSKQPQASALAVAKRVNIAAVFRKEVIELWRHSSLPRHQRAAFICYRLKLSGTSITPRRVRQIINSVPGLVSKRGNYGG